ncbi:MAG: hypothetical protein L0Y44_03145 [Phycisphaerales bacterium]|nr:hypothetical protein [Phycisphaerales bacterium]MCI0629633.1 hypothetical protein [Phycisphaerales bacterium]MCI0676208.1 hypothetical protein [Phycisphaerales bacterium]
MPARSLHNLNQQRIQFHVDALDRSNLALQPCPNGVPQVAADRLPGGRIDSQLRRRTQLNPINSKQPIDKRSSGARFAVHMRLAVSY